MTSATDAGATRAAERVARTITAVAGVATIAFFALAIGQLTAAAPLMSPVYTVVGALIVFGVPPVLAIVGFFVSLDVLKRMLAAYALAFLAVVVLWIPAMMAPLPAGVAPWPVEVTALATVPAAIAWRPITAWAYLVANSVIIAPLRYFAGGQVDLSVPLQYSFFTLTFAAIFTALAMVAMRNGYALDRAIEIARGTSARAAAAASRAQEQARLDALVHDNVMATLFYASRGGLDDSVRKQAQKTLTQLEQLRGGRDQVTEPVGVDDFVARIRSVVLDASPDITFSTNGGRSSPIPFEVAAAFAEATSEAVRNSLQHAGSGSAITRSATIAFTERTLRVIVRDDGRGFDTRDIPPHRLGILVSIRGRLATIRGGNGRVESRRGLGTVVTLSWVGP